MKYEVVVVGAGPSGSTAAKTLAKNGVKVLIVDKETFPRDKPCGGGLPLRTLTRFPYIKQLNVIESYSYGGFIYSPSSKYHVAIKKTDPVIAMVLRSTFDNELVKLSINEGADFQENKTVTHVKIHPTHAQISFADGTSIATELIIGADGFHSTIARKTGFNAYNRDKGICILEEFPVSKEIIESIYTDKHLCYIHSKFQGIRGYGWVFPKENHINVGLAVYESKEQLKKRQYDLRSLFQEYISILKRQNALPSQLKSVKMKGGILPVRPLPKTVSDRVLLCGDAAGLINPISGEGIYYALVSGEIAGDIASDSIKHQDTTERFLKTYEKRWKQDFGKEIRLFLRSKKQWGKQGDRTVKLMNNDPQFAELIFLIMVGKESAYDLRWKIIKRYIYSSFFHRKE
ncbi:MAG: NAD(P)/FAD-dependent oxidoreductase [Candidatus Thermoplasmatota archaeon]|nr:NAD(P)/FAD-dependent oxidoreductase [Candidatus Thermoplasmatota archaeon]